MACCSSYSFGFFGGFIAFDVMSKTHRWVTFNINLQLFSDCQKKPVNIEEKAVFRAVNPPAAGSPCVPFRDFLEDYSALIPTLHPTAFIAYVFVAVIWQICESSSHTR